MCLLWHIGTFRGLLCVLVGRLQQIHLDVSNSSDGSSAQQCAYDAAGFNASETRVYTCPAGISGRYVRIRFDDTYTSSLELAEVQVQGEGMILKTFAWLDSHKMYFFVLCFSKHQREWLLTRTVLGENDMFLMLCNILYLCQKVLCFPPGSSDPEDPSSISSLQQTVTAWPQVPLVAKESVTNTSIFSGDLALAATPKHSGLKPFACCLLVSKFYFVGIIWWSKTKQWRYTHLTNWIRNIYQKTPSRSHCWHTWITLHSLLLTHITSFFQSQSQGLRDRLRKIKVVIFNNHVFRFPNLVRQHCSYWNSHSDIWLSETRRFSARLCNTCHWWKFGDRCTRGSSVCSDKFQCRSLVAGGPSSAPHSADSCHHNK